MRVRFPRRAPLVLATLALATAVLASPASAADGSLLVQVPGDPAGFVHESSTSVFGPLHLAPGTSTDGTVGIRNDYSQEASLVLQVSGLRNLENGCERPEVNSGDATCDADGGELSEWLELTVSSDDGELWQGRLAEVEAAQVPIGLLGAGETESLTMTLALPVDAGNNTMTDSVSFGLRFTAMADGAVLGPPAGTGGSDGVAGPPAPGSSSLPDTGSPISALLLLLDAVLLGAGALLVWGAVRGRQRRPALA